MDDDAARGCCQGSSENGAGSDSVAATFKRRYLSRVKMEELQRNAGRSRPKTNRTKRVGLFVVPVLLVLLLAGTGCGSLPTADLRLDYPEEKIQIEQRLHEIFVAAETKDFDRLEAYHWYGPKFTKFSASASQRLDAVAGRKGERDGLGAVQGLRMQADALKIDVFGNVGVATFLLDYSFISGGDTVHKRDRSTLVFVREKGVWKIVHEHMSPIT